MIRITKKLTLAASLTAIVLGLGTGIAFASTESDTDGISPASTSFTATSTNIIFRGTVDNIMTTITCTSSRLSSTTPGSGLGPFDINDPSFTGCTANGVGATINTNSTNGSWQLKFIDVANDEGIVIGGTTDEPPGHPGHSGDQMQITIPKGGATFTSSAFPCKITAAPAGSAIITGAYDDTNKLTFSSESFPVQGDNTCSASSSFTISGSYASDVNIQDVS